MSGLFEKLKSSLPGKKEAAAPAKGTSKFAAKGKGGKAPPPPKKAAPKAKKVR